jgi:hypothetical protein
MFYAQGQMDIESLKPISARSKMARGVVAGRAGRVPHLFYVPFQL